MSEEQDRAQKLAAFRAKVAKRMVACRLKPRPTSPAPRYDEVYAEGVAWLDELP